MIGLPPFNGYMTTPTVIVVLIASLMAITGCARPNKGVPGSDGGPTGSESALVIDSVGNLFGTFVGQDVYFIPRYQKIGVVDLFNGLKPDSYPCSFANLQTQSACDVAGRYIDASCTTPHIPVWTRANVGGRSIVYLSRSERVLLIKNGYHRVQPQYIGDSENCTKVDYSEDSFTKEAFIDVTDDIRAVSVPLPLSYEYQ